MYILELSQQNPLYNYHILIKTFLEEYFLIPEGS
jgi:hypothetical protein